MDSPAFDVLIVGGGHAGAHAAIALRHAKFSGSITIVTDEPELPYERPPLSKDYFSGAKTFERLLLRPAHFWEELHVQFIHRERIVGVDPPAHEVRAESGRSYRYGTLVWATGGRPRTLKLETPLAGVHTVRTRSDIDRMTLELPQVEHVVIVGGGYIGLEAASVLRKLGKPVTLLELLPRILGRVAGVDIAEFFTHEHRAHGVEIMTETAIQTVDRSNGCVTGVTLANGRAIAANMLIVGIGIIPNVEPLIAAGAVGSNGVHVDEMCRTSLPDVYAIGDCAAHINAFAGGERIRLESVQNAHEQATSVGKTIGGTPTPYHALPWFWSDQYDLKLQTVGVSTLHDAAIVRGDPATRSFSVVYLRKERVIALDCVNCARDYVQGRKLVTDGAVIDPVALANPAIALKDLPRSA